jgi:hypothetical protein
LDNCALHPELVEHEKTKSDEAHVRNRRVGHQLFHVRLHQRNKADVNHGSQRQANHKPAEFLTGIRRDG